MQRRSERLPVPNRKYQEASVEAPKIPKKMQANKDIKTKKKEKQEQQKKVLEKKKVNAAQKKNEKEKEEIANVIYTNKLLKQKRLEELYIPDDEISTKINKSLIKMKVLFDNEKLSYPDSLINGTQLLEVKPADYQQPKQILWSKFKAGEYHTADSNSDIKSISAKIKTFTNQFPSFQKYKDVEDMSWIINHHRELFHEMIEHITAISQTKSKLSPSSFKAFINVILRILRLGYNSKSTPLYVKYSMILEDVSKSIKDRESEQSLNDVEKTKFLEWKYVVLERNKFEKEFNDVKDIASKKDEAFKLNQSLILTSLYTLTPVLRREVASLYFTHKKPLDKRGDYVYFHPKGGVSLELYEVKKRHGYISIPLNYREEKTPTGISKFILKNQEHLANLLKESYELYKREPVFVNESQYRRGKIVAVKNASVCSRLGKIYSIYNVNVGASSLRSSYITYLNNLFIKKTGNVLTAREKDEIAEKYMRTTREQLDTAYAKIFRTTDVSEIALDAIALDDDNNEIQVKKENEINEEEEEIGYERNPLVTNLIKPVYERHLERINNAYRNSKPIEVKDDNGEVKITTEAREQKRVYYHIRDKFAISRQRILREYHSSTRLRKLTDKTIAKYNFTEEELTKAA